MSRTRSQHITIKSEQPREEFSHYPAEQIETFRDLNAGLGNSTPSSLFQFTREDFYRMGHKLDRTVEENEELKEKVLRLKSELASVKRGTLQETLAKGTPTRSPSPLTGRTFTIPFPRRVLSTIHASQAPEDYLQQGVETVNKLEDEDPHIGLAALKDFSEHRLREYIRVLESYILTLDIYAKPHPPELKYLLEGRRVNNKHIDMGGREYVGQSIAGKPSGKGKLASPGNILEGSFLDGKPHGKITITKDDHREKCNFVYGIKQGFYEKHYKDGSFESGCLVDGISVGSKKIVHADGSLEYLSVHEGKAVGVSIKLSRDKTQIEVTDRTGAHLIRHLYKKKLHM